MFPTDARRWNLHIKTASLKNLWLLHLTTIGLVGTIATAQAQQVCHAPTGAGVTVTCADLGDFGPDECSVREMRQLLGQVNVDNVSMTINTVPNRPEDDRILVTGVGAGTNRPGIHFEVLDGALALSPCLGFWDLYSFSIAAFGNSIEIADAMLAVDYSDVHTGSGADFDGAYLFGTMNDTPFVIPPTTNVSFVTPTDAFGIPFSPILPSTVPLPATLSYPAPASLRQLQVFLEHHGINGAHCDQTAALNGWTVTFGMTNLPPLPVGVGVSGALPCIAGDGGALNPDVDVTVNSACDPQDAGAEIVDNLGLPTVRLTTCDGAEDNSTALSMTMDTPLSSFELWFDYRFASNSELKVSLNDTPLTAIPAKQGATYTRESLLVNDPALMGLQDAELKFELVGDGSELNLGNIFSPTYDIDVGFRNVAAKVDLAVVDDTLCRTTNSNGNVLYACSDPELTEEDDAVVDAFLAFVDLTLENVCASCDGFVNGRARAVADPLTGGISWSNYLEARADIVDNFDEVDLADIGPSTTWTNAVKHYRITAIDDEVSTGEPVPIDYVMSITGDIVLEGDFEGLKTRLLRSFNQVKYNVDAAVTINRAARDGQKQSFTLYVRPTEAPVIAAGAVRNNCAGEEDATSPLFLAEETAPGGVLTSRTFSFRQQFCFPSLLYAKVGDEVQVDATVELLARNAVGWVRSDVDPDLYGPSGFNGTILADFARTAELMLSTSTPGVVLQLVDDSAPPDNNPPEADAGADQTVEANSAEGTDVALDGSGTSDEDGDVLSYEWFEGGSIIASGVSPTIALAIGSHDITLTVDDGRGGSSSDSVTVTVQDSTPPNVTATVVPAANGNGWNNTDVFVNFAGTDVNSVSDPVQCNTASSHLTTEGADQPANSTCADQAGNEAIAATSVSIDKSPPVVDVNCPATVGQNQPADATVAVSDVLSGIDNQSHPNGDTALDTSALGPQSFQVTATDLAGNQASMSCNYNVFAPVLAFEGFFSPVGNAPEINTAKAGQGVAMKWRIPDGQGGYLSDLSLASGLHYALVACPEAAEVDGEPVEAETSGQSGLHYDEDDEQFVYVWKTPKALKGSCADFVLALNDGSEHRAHFLFK